MAGVTDLEGNPIPDDVCPIHLVQYADGFDCTLCPPLKLQGTQ